ncbi:MAG: asparagine synthase (glutamine-hydrolyzing) [Ruminococcus sp.]|nr:asparagine synthase (glutamine-hydrolyzing) [Ruminococcus sp.]
MCGICGMVSFKQDMRQKKCILAGMQNALLRRGPDQEGMFCTEPECIMAHRRLAVIDVDHGRQPMTRNHNGETYTIVYNGELYNTDELRQELIALGAVFETTCDTEVVLEGYIYWGEECVTRFNGIFAFAVWEHKKERLWLARDRMGVKPLFYAETEDGFTFASDINSILQNPDVPREIDLTGLSELILMMPGRTAGYGVFRTVREFVRAECGYYDKTGLHKKIYWKLKARPHTDNIEQTAERVRFLVEDSITRQLVSDVPVGTFLSGGLDSSIISSVAARSFRKKGIKLPTFSLDYKSNDRYFQKSKFQPTSDSEFIGDMAEYLESESFITALDTPELAAALVPAMEARGLPGMGDVDSSMLLFCKDIRSHVTVALSGECSDEIFGGYPWYRDETIRMSEGFPWAQSTAYRQSFLNDELSELIDGRAYVDKAYRNTVSQAEKLSGESIADSRTREMMLLNLDWFMQNLLDRKDRMSMYSSLEVRVPFCDYRIAEYLYNVPWEYKDYKGYEKGLLREAMKDYLPERILWRKKSPYPKTHNPAYFHAVSKMLRKIISDPNAPVLSIIKKERLEQLLTGTESVQWYGQLMAKPQTIAFFVQLNEWMKKYDVKIRI